MEKQCKPWQTLFWGAPKSLQMVTAALKLKDACSLEEKLWPTETAYIKQRHHFANKNSSSQIYGFSSSDERIWELYCKESLAPKNWCFWTVVLEKTLESPLDCKEIQPVHPKGYQSWVFIGRTDAEAETPILWPPDMKNWLIWKDPDDGKDWRWEEKGTTEDAMFGWHHQLNRHEFEQGLGAGEGQGGLACCSPWGHKVGHNWVSELNRTDQVFKAESFLLVPVLVWVKLTAAAVGRGCRLFGWLFEISRQGLCLSPHLIRALVSIWPGPPISAGKSIPTEPVSSSSL